MKNSCLLYTLVASVFLMLISGSLLTTGMFMDGLIYGNVADNMASGLCTFWHPMHSPSLHADFYEHPPLVMGLLALFYKVLGTHVWVTRLFTMVTTVLTAWLTVRLWVRLGYKRRTGWLPLLLWVLIPAMTRNAHDNMLECTMVIFVLAAVLCLLHYDSRRRLLWAAAGGAMLYCAFLCKGFTGLYPFALPAIVWVVDLCSGRHRHAGRALLMAVADTLMAVGAFAVCMATTGLLFPESVHYFEQYMTHQVLGNLDTPIVSNRWTIEWNFIEQTLIVWGVALVVLVIAHAQRRERVVLRSDWRNFAICLLVALSGVLPIAISLKQHGFYILTVYPIVAVGAGALVQGPVKAWMEGGGKRLRTALAVLTVLAVTGAVVLNAMHYGQPGRDVAMQQDMQQIIPQVAEGEQVGIPMSLAQEWSLYAYYYREKHIDLTRIDLQNLPEALPRHLLTDGRDAVPQELYTEKTLATRQYKLYELKQ